MFVDETRPMYKVYITQLVSITKTAWGRRATGERGCGVWGQGRGCAEKDGEKREMGPRQIGVGGRRRRKSWEWGVGVGTSWFRPDTDVRWVYCF